MIETLKQVPFWAWVIIPTLILAVISFIVTRNKWTMLRVSGIALVVAWLTAGFHFWEVYLGTHYLGGFNEYGLPADFSRTGWALLIDAFTLWAVPSLICALIASLLTGFFLTREPNQTPNSESDEENMPLTSPSKTGMSSSDLVNQLEIQKLKRKLELAKSKIREARSGQVDSKEAQRTETYKAELKKAQKENQAHIKQISTLGDDLKRAKHLIERLLDERLELNRKLKHGSDELPDRDE